MRDAKKSVNGGVNTGGKEFCALKCAHEFVIETRNVTLKEDISSFRRFLKLYKNCYRQESNILKTKKKQTCFRLRSFSRAAAGMVEMECLFGADGGFVSSSIFGTKLLHNKNSLKQNVGQKTYFL